MAIWPFGRRGKRHTIQIDSTTGVDASLSHDLHHSPDEGNLGRKPSRKQSKRQKNRHSQPAEDFPASFQDVSPPSSQPAYYPPSTSQSERPRPVKAATLPSSNTSKPEPQTLSRNPSLLKPRRNENPAVLKKRLSKRKAYEIAREREIRLMASTPIDIPRRATTPLPGENALIEGLRGPSAQSRRLNRHPSDISLSIHDSVASSLSDFSETYTFKVNSFAAWTPRPVIRYVESPRLSNSRNQKSPEPTADQRVKTSGLAPSEENMRSKKRIEELADDLDAAALRELMERDRRRRDRKQIEDQEKMYRRLQRSAMKQAQQAEIDKTPNPHEVANVSSVESQLGRLGPESPFKSQPTTQEDSSSNANGTFVAKAASGSWLRGTSNDAERSDRESPESVHVIGNIDDRSVRERKPEQRLSLRPSQDMAMSRSTLSPSLSPSRHALGSPNSSQFYGVTRESASDLSRPVESERHLSDHGGVRVNTITSIFRRGSSRLKRSYRERFQDRSPPPPDNVSHESFFKVHTQQSIPPPYVPPKILLGSSSFKRSHSKFTEIFGDEPLSPPDSRLQSPDIPEQPVDESLMEAKVLDLHVGSQYPIPGSESDPQEVPKNGHHSCSGDSLGEDSENVPLSQSLASIDSEGSWMSGQFLRRISQRPSNLARHSISSSQNRTDEALETSSKCNEIANDEQFVAFGAYPGEVSGDGNSPADEPSKDLDMLPAPEPTQETWHEEIAKRPVLVNPAVRPKSNEGLLKNVRSLSPISAEMEFSPIEEHSEELLFPTAHGSSNIHGRSCGVSSPSSHQ
ncbi:hypothetical protein ARAM_007587 [Aspergillus rambellii]|uniref:Uncharacterized protein n=1 Tax=Aspergillus rambellii TaxID=308745 RepID=A0A0F8X4W4_9EURO|nr:hypothetical protein ARAM_007587 [Aspergillus rambellii]